MRGQITHVSPFLEIKVAAGNRVRFEEVLVEAMNLVYVSLLIHINFT